MQRPRTLGSDLIPRSNRGYLEVRRSGENRKRYIQFPALLQPGSSRLEQFAAARFDPVSVDLRGGITTGRIQERDVVGQPGMLNVWFREEQKTLVWPNSEACEGLRLSRLPGCGLYQ